MFIKRPLIHNKGLPILCLQNIKFPSIIKLTNKYYKDKLLKNFTGNLKKMSYLVSYDSLTDYDNQIINNSLSYSLPNYSADVLISIICFFSLSSIIFYFYRPKK
jgi:hypothetical protein